MWASLIPYAKVIGLLKDVLPVAQTLNPETVRCHLHATATRLEQALGEEHDCLFTGSEDDWAAIVGLNVRGPFVGIQVQRYQRGLGTSVGPKMVLTFLLP